MNIWRSRGSSMYGRVTIIKTLGLSEFLYIASLINVPEWVINILLNPQNMVLFGKVKRIESKEPY